MKYKVLIIDDSSSICNTLKSLIQSDIDVDVFIAKSLKESAKMLLQEKGKFDIFLADLGLPDAPNGEVIDFLSKFSIPIVVLTGSEDIDIEEKFRNKNIVDYIIKDGISALTYATSIVSRIIHNKDIKIVLTDYLMPNMNGLELTKKIRKDYSKDELSIIVTSNDSSKKIPAKFLKYGANDFLYKGFSNEEFFARINSNIEILELFDEIKNKANKDYLTGLFNRRYLFDVGAKLYLESKSNNKLFSVAIIDIDNFKMINDTYGHDVGDIAIKEVSKILNKNISSNAIISRLGGEEFCICFYNRSKSEISELLEYIRKEFENNQIKINDLILKYTISIGATLDLGKSFDDMIRIADEYLYTAKKEGRNRVRTNESRLT